MQSIQLLSSISPNLKPPSLDLPSTGCQSILVLWTLWLLHGFCHTTCRLVFCYLISRTKKKIWAILLTCVTIINYFRNFSALITCLCNKSNTINSNISRRDASPSWPLMAALTLDNKHSIKCATVILEGITWGLIIKSGTIPSAVSILFSSALGDTSVPFWPCHRNRIYLWLWTFLQSSSYSCIWQNLKPSSFSY